MKNPTNAINAIDGCLEGLGLLLEYLALLKKQGDAATVLGLDELLGMTYSRLSDVLVGLKEASGVL